MNTFSFKKDLIRIAKIAILAIALTVGVDYLFAAWSAPSATPPNGNIAAPINTGSVGQYKAGALSIDTTTLPAAGDALDVNGLLDTTSLKITGGTPANGDILTSSDGSGDASWQAPSTHGLVATIAISSPRSTNGSYVGGSYASYTIPMSNADYVIGRIGGSDGAGGEVVNSFYLDFTYVKATNTFSYVLENPINGTATYNGGFANGTEPYGNVSLQSGTVYTVLPANSSNSTKVPYVSNLPIVAQQNYSGDPGISSLYAAYYNTATNSLLIGYYPVAYYSTMGLYANTFSY